MVTVYDVRTNELIDAVKEELKDKIEQPEWSDFVKTSPAKERPPQQDDWWYLRAAAILGKIYKKGSMGVNRLRREYGDRKDRGHKPDHSRPASGKIIRTILQQLEEIGFLEMEEGVGRKITPDGRSFMDDIARKVKE